MDRWTVWDEELGSFLPTKNAEMTDSKVTYYDIRLINYIGQLEDELERIKENAAN